MDILLRKAEPKDAAKILEYCKTVGSETENLTFGSEGVTISLEREQTYLESIYNSEKNLYLLAIFRNRTEKLQAGNPTEEIAGCCVLTSYAKLRLSHRAEISLTVKKKFWGQGIGTKLLRAALDFAKHTAKTKIVSLEVRSDNSRAVALYKKFGFEKIGTFEGFLNIGDSYIDCDIMRLDLAAESATENRRNKPCF